MKTNVYPNQGDQTTQRGRIMADHSDSVLLVPSTNPSTAGRDILHETQHGAVCEDEILRELKIGPLFVSERVNGQKENVLNLHFQNIPDWAYKATKYWCSYDKSTKVKEVTINPFLNKPIGYDQNRDVQKDDLNKSSATANLTDTKSESPSSKQSIKKDGKSTSNDLKKDTKPLLKSIELQSAKNDRKVKHLKEKYNGIKESHSSDSDDSIDSSDDEHEHDKLKHLIVLRPRYFGGDMEYARDYFADSLPVSTSNSIESWIYKYYQIMTSSTKGKKIVYFRTEGKRKYVEVRPKYDHNISLITWFTKIVIASIENHSYYFHAQFFKVMKAHLKYTDSLTKVHDKVTQLIRNWNIDEYKVKNIDKNPNFDKYIWIIECIGLLMKMHPDNDEEVISGKMSQRIRESLGRNPSSIIRNMIPLYQDFNTKAELDVFMMHLDKEMSYRIRRTEREYK